MGVGLSFTDWDGLSQERNFNGLDNLVRFFHDPMALEAFGNTLVLTVSVVVFQNVLGLLMAVGLNTNIKSRNILRTLLFAPAIMTPVVIAFVWQYIYSTNGALNTALGALGLENWQQSWLGDQHLVLGSVIVVIVWQFAGYSMVIYLAGLQGVPEELLEAASIDGANSVQRFFWVTLPQLGPATTVSVVLSTMNALKLFDQVYAMTGGGPGTASQVVSGFQYKTAFSLARFGYGNMVALLLTVIVATVSFAQMRLLNRKGGQS
jgi:raffinose/stachyose/melibiose transport system permease protein